jgi:hypothetical protein
MLECANLEVGCYVSSPFGPRRARGSPGNVGRSKSATRQDWCCEFLATVLTVLVGFDSQAKRSR